jgi:hypothetical protein
VAAEICSHLQSISSLKTAKVGSLWVHLRTCQTCGATLCCDSSPNRHATKHARASGHPVITSAEAGERWLFCYVDNSFAEY